MAVGKVVADVASTCDGSAAIDQALAGDSVQSGTAGPSGAFSKLSANRIVPGAGPVGVGVGVGAGVGVGVGLAVGSAVGLAVGAAVGLAVGTGVCATTGAGVGVWEATTGTGVALGLGPGWEVGPAAEACPKGSQ